MRIYMQIPPDGDKAPRYYHLHLQEDLLEGWTLIREWGYQGASGRVKREHFADHEAAESAKLNQWPSSAILFGLLAVGHMRKLPASPTRVKWLQLTVIKGISDDRWHTASNTGPV